MTVTAEIRKIIREAGLAGSYEMWTNKYAKTRSVKASVGNLEAKATKEKVQAVKVAISKRLDELGVKGYSFKEKQNSLGPYCSIPDAFIVTVPRDDV